MTNDKELGISIIQKHLVTMPKEPGVYRMLDRHGNVLYVGKAKNLAKRVANYTHPERLSYRIKMMVYYTAHLEIIITPTEAEALLLEASLIKSLQPRYNILLRDDKSFPYILLREDHEFSQILKYRGNQSIKGKYFGPFASVRDVENTISQLQKIFRLRSCSDSYFANRKRPCMLYQIKKCSAPCVGKIDQSKYHELVKQAEDFLSGKTNKLQSKLVKLMDEASHNTEYEQAAIYRDRIKALTAIQTKNDIGIQGLKDSDVIALHHELGQYCIQIFFFRGGQNYGNKAYFPSHAEEATEQEVMLALIGQFYQTHVPPPQILLNIPLEEKNSIELALAKLAKGKVTIEIPKLGNKKRIIELAEHNAKEALKRRVSALSKQRRIFEEIQTLFNLPSKLIRIEVFDNSHLMGKHAVGAMIVATEEGFIKNEYKKFNMDKVTANNPKGGDDYAMLREMLTRRLTKLKISYPAYYPEKWPDLLLIDGGMAHLGVAKSVLKDLDLDFIPTVCIAKGIDRNAGKETFFMVNQMPFTLERDDPVMRYLQILRDEAHRFAIGSHRKRRSMDITTSILDNIPGIAKKRKKALLNYFGSIKAIEDARVEDLMKINNINKTLAETIYNYLHNKQ